MKKIAFTGPFSDINFGDYGMVINNIYDLDIDKATLFTYNDEFLSDLKNEYLNDCVIELKKINLVNDFKERLSDNMTPVELLYLVENYEEIVKEIDKIDVLIVNGGGYFNGLWSMPHRLERLIKIFIPILIANRKNKKIIFMGNSFGPFGEDDKFFASLFNSLNNVIFSCRDKLYSSSWLKQLGVEDENIKYLPDDLLFINNNILEKSTSFTIPDEDYIVMETYLSLDYFKDNIEIIRSFSQVLKDKYNMKIVFVPFNLKHGGMQQAEFFNQEFENIEIFNINKTGFLPLQDAAKVISNAKLVISNRYHALVLALNYGTPIINVLRDVMDDKRYYYNKSAGMINEILFDIPYDERLYLGLDYIEVLSFLKDNLHHVLAHQNNNYNLQYEENKKNLKKIRNEHLKEILS